MGERTESDKIEWRIADGPVPYDEAVAEMERRYQLMSALGVRNISGYNRHVKDATAAGKKLGDDSGTKLADAKKIVPQVMIYSNGDLSSFEVTLEREGGVRSITLAQDEKGKVIAKPMVETRL